MYHKEHISWIISAYATFIRDAVCYYKDKRKAKNSSTFHEPLPSGDRFLPEKLFPGFPGTVDDRQEPYAATVQEQQQPVRKIRVRMEFSSLSYWNSYETLWRAFEADDRFECCILATDGILDSCRNGFLGDHKWMPEHDYDAETDQTDIMLITMHGGAEALAPNVKKGREHIRLVAAVVGELNSVGPSRKFNGMGGYDQYRPDFYIMDGLLYEYARHLRARIPMYKMGNCKYDGIYRGIINGKQYQPGWEKLKGKRVVLWASDHGLDENGSIRHMVTFDLYCRKLLEYASSHPDMGFLLRPHSALVGELQNWGYWPGNTFEQIKEYCNRTPNVVWDSNRTYHNAFSVADAILVDGFCGIIASALPLEKPMCAAFRNDMPVMPTHAILMDSLYQAINEDDMVEFFEMLRKGQDPRKARRLAASDRYVCHFDGRNGTRMKEFITEKYAEKLK